PNISMCTRRLKLLNSSRKCLPQLRTDTTRRPCMRWTSSLLLPSTWRTVLRRNRAAPSRRMTRDGPSGTCPPGTTPGGAGDGLEAQGIGGRVGMRGVVEDHPGGRALAGRDLGGERGQRVVVVAAVVHARRAVPAPVGPACGCPAGKCGFRRAG